MLQVPGLDPRLGPPSFGHELHGPRVAAKSFGEGWLHSQGASSLFSPVAPGVAGGAPCGRNKADWPPPCRGRGNFGRSTNLEQRESLSQKLSDTINEHLRVFKKWKIRMSAAAAGSSAQRPFKSVAQVQEPSSSGPLGDEGFVAAAAAQAGAAAAIAAVAEMSAKASTATSSKLIGDPSPLKLSRPTTPGRSPVAVARVSGMIGGGLAVSSVATVRHAASVQASTRADINIADLQDVPFSKRQRQPVQARTKKRPAAKKTHESNSGTSAAGRSMLNAEAADASISTCTAEDQQALPGRTLAKVRTRRRAGTEPAQRRSHPQRAAAAAPRGKRISKTGSKKGTPQAAEDGMPTSDLVLSSDHECAGGLSGSLRASACEIGSETAEGQSTSVCRTPSSAAQGTAPLEGFHGQDALMARLDGLQNAIEALMRQRSLQEQAVEVDPFRTGKFVVHQPSVAATTESHPSSDQLPLHQVTDIRAPQKQQTAATSFASDVDNRRASTCSQLTFDGAGEACSDPFMLESSWM